MEPRYIESPTNQAVPCKLAEALGETATGGPLDKSGDQKKAKWAISNPCSSDEYIRMNTVGTITSSPNSELPK